MRLALGILSMAFGCSEGIEPLPSDTEDPFSFPKNTALVDVHPDSGSLLLLVEDRSLVWLDLSDGTRVILSDQIDWRSNPRRRGFFTANGEAVVYSEWDGFQGTDQNLSLRTQLPLLQYRDGELSPIQSFVSRTRNAFVFFADGPRPRQFAYKANPRAVFLHDVDTRAQRFGGGSGSETAFDVLPDGRVETSLLDEPAEAVWFVDRAYVARVDDRVVLRSAEGDQELPAFAEASFRSEVPKSRDEAVCALTAGGALMRLDLESFEVRTWPGDFVDWSVQGPWCLGLEQRGSRTQLTALGAEGEPWVSHAAGMACSFPSTPRGGVELLEGCDLAVIDGRLVDLPIPRLFFGPTGFELAREDVMGQDYGVFLGRSEGNRGLSVWRWTPASGLERTDHPDTGSRCGFELVPSVDPDFVRWRDETSGLPRFEQRTYFLSQTGRFLRCASSGDEDGVQLWLVDGRGGEEQRLNDVPVQTELRGFAFSARVLFHDEMTVVLDEAGAEEGRLRLRVFEHPRPD